MQRRVRVAAEDGQELPLGRTRKRHPRDCGNPRCGHCSGGRRWYATADRMRGNREALRLESL